jgi:hypothetical protein
MKALMRALLGMALLLLVSQPARADLILRNGLVYDTVQDLTWLQDPLYARSAGYTPDGRMTIDEASLWAADLVAAGYDDWRLPVRFAFTPGQEYVNRSSEIARLLAQLGWHWTENRGDYIAGGTGPFVNFPSDYGQFWLANSNGRYWHSTLELDVPDPDSTRHRAWAVRDGAPVGVPEPATWLLVGLGLVFAGRRRARRSHGEAS